MDRETYVKKLQKALGNDIAMLGGEIRPHDLVCLDDHLTEQEHIPLCDVNRMVKNAMRGQAVLTNGQQPIYGYDDTTMDGHTLRIQRAQLESELQEFANANELSEEEAKLIPKTVQEKFKIRIKKAKASDEKNDDQTTNKTPTADPSKQSD